MVCSGIWVRKAKPGLAMKVKVVEVSGVEACTLVLRSIDRQGVQPSRMKTFRRPDLAAGVIWPLGDHDVTRALLEVVPAQPGTSGVVQVDLEIDGQSIFSSQCGQPDGVLDGEWRVTTWT